MTVFKIFDEFLKATKKVKESIKKEEEGKEKEARLKLQRADMNIFEINEELIPKLKDSCKDISKREVKDMDYFSWKAHKKIVEMVGSPWEPPKKKEIKEEDKKEIIKKLTRFLGEVETALM